MAKDQPISEFEYASVALRIDHLVTDPMDNEDGEVTILVQYSSFDAHHHMLKQLRYFVAKGEGINLAAIPDGFDTLAAARDQNAVYVYTPSERISLVLMDTDTYVSIKERAGLEASTHAVILKMVTDAANNFTVQRQGIPPLFIIKGAHTGIPGPGEAFPQSLDEDDLDYAEIGRQVVAAAGRAAG